MISNPIMQPYSNVAATASRLDSDEEITFRHPAGERNSNWCKVPASHFLTRPLMHGWRWLGRCDLAHAFAVWCWDLQNAQHMNTMGKTGASRGGCTVTQTVTDEFWFIVSSLSIHWMKGTHYCSVKWHEVNRKRKGEEAKIKLFLWW